MKIRPLAYPTQKKQQLLNWGSSFQPKLLSAGFINPKTAPGSWWSSKGPQGVALNKFSAGPKNWTKAPEWGNKKTHHENERNAFFGSFPHMMPPAKRVHGMGRVENVQDFLLNFSGRQKLPIQKRKCAKVLGSYKRHLSRHDLLWEKSPWKITHSYGMYQ